MSKDLKQSAVLDDMPEPHVECTHELDGDPYRESTTGTTLWHPEKDENTEENRRFDMVCCARKITGNWCCQNANPQRTV